MPCSFLTSSNLQRRIFQACALVAAPLILSGCLYIGGLFRYSPDLTFEPNSLQPGKQGVFYSRKIKILDAQTPIMSAGFEGGRLPAGLELKTTEEASDVVLLSGVPSESGEFEFELGASCYGTMYPGQTGQQKYKLVIAPASE